MYHPMQGTVLHALTQFTETEKYADKLKLKKKLQAMYIFLDENVVNNCKKNWFI